jgi:hypothetical protein
MINDTTSEYELTELSLSTESDHFVEIDLTPPPSPIIPLSTTSFSSIAHALTQPTIRAKGRRTDDGQALEWQGLVFKIDLVENGPLQKGQFIDIAYSDFRQVNTTVLGEIIGRWHHQDKNRWVLYCKMVSDTVVGFHFLVVLPKDARLLTPRSPLFLFFYFLFSYFLVRKVSYKD